MKQIVCTIINILCENFDSTKSLCLACRTGYFLQDNDCIYPALGYDENCIRYSGSYCSNCKPKFYLKSFTCSAVDNNCLTFNYDLNICNTCIKGKKAIGPICKWYILFRLYSLIF